MVRCSHNVFIGRSQKFEIRTACASSRNLSPCHFDLKLKYTVSHLYRTHQSLVQYFKPNISLISVSHVMLNMSHAKKIIIIENNFHPTSLNLSENSGFKILFCRVSFYYSSNICLFLLLTRAKNSLPHCKRIDIAMLLRSLVPKWKVNRRVRATVRVCDTCSINCKLKQSPSWVLNNM